MNTGHKAIFRTLEMDSRKQCKHTGMFRCSVLCSLLTSIHYVEEVIFGLISQENNITSLLGEIILLLS